MIRLSVLTLRHASERYASVLETQSLLAIWFSGYGKRYLQADNKKWIRKAQVSLLNNKACHFAILDSNGCFVGEIAADCIDLGSGQANVMFWIRRSAQHRQYATEALLQLKQWAAHLRLRRLVLKVEAGNLGSIRVGLKAGARFQSSDNDSLLHPGCPVMTYYIPVSPLPTKPELLTSRII